YLLTLRDCSQFYRSSGSGYAVRSGNSSREIVIGCAYSFCSIARSVNCSPTPQLPDSSLAQTKPPYQVQFQAQGAPSSIIRSGSGSGPFSVKAIILFDGV